MTTEANVASVLTQLPGNSSNKLLNNNLDPRVLRPWIGEDGMPYMDVGSSAVAPTTNATLRKDEWIQLDSVLLSVARSRMRGIMDLINAGLVYRMNGLANPILQYERVSDMTPATVTMDGLNRGHNDRVEYDIASLPMPIIHKDFVINSRFLAASRNNGAGVDSTQQELAARKVSELLETWLFQGTGSYTYGQATIYGYTDYPGRNTGSLTAAWDASGTTGAMILKDCRTMKQALIDARQFGEYVIYVPTAYETKLDDDFKAEGDKTIRERILGIESVMDVKVSDFLPTDQVIMVQMDASTVRLVEGMPMTNVQWDSEGGFALNYKVMTIMVPQIREDQEGHCGIAHFVV
jgi:hypothetical protein